MKNALAKMVVLGALFACGNAPPPREPAILVKPTAHARTEAERRKDVCGRTDLVALEGPIVAGAASSTQQPERGLVRKVSVVDLAGREVQTSTHALDSIKLGAELDAEATREAVRRLWREGRFDDVAVETTREGDGVAVVLRVTPRRTIDKVFAVTTDDADASALGLVQGRFYDPVALVSAERSLRGALKNKGFPDASIVVTTAFSDESRSTIDACVRVDRGARVVLDKIDVTGSAFSAALAAELAKDDTTNVPGAVLDEDVLERDVLLLAAWLYDHGLLSHKIDKTIERHGDKVTVALAVTDGPTFRYGAIDMKGDLAAPKADYMKLVGLKRGDVFNRSAVVAVIDALRSFDKSKGHYAIDIVPLTELDTSKQTVALTFELKDEGKFAIVELAPGSGRAALKGDRVSVHYKGMLVDGTVFDTSKKHGPFDFTIGGNMVIPGFDKGVTGMKVGGKRRVTIPPDMGYGPRGAPPSIPGNAVLVFEIELLAIR